MTKPLDDNQKLIIKYLRKAWLYSKERRATIKAALAGDTNAEGEKLYWCKVCKPAHKVVKGYVDHRESMVLLPGFDSWDKLISRLFNVDNQQFICKLAHKKKTKIENAERRRLKNV